MVAAVNSFWKRLLPCLAGMATASTFAIADMNPPATSPVATRPSVERITFGGGCFWCIEAVFQRLAGVQQVVSGYAGGAEPDPTYEAVSSGKTGHAEVVQLTFDPAQVSYEKLLEVFWAAHDPTTVLEEDVVRQGKRYPKGTPYQGADIGRHYRSIILFENEAQQKLAEASRKVAQKDHQKPVVTEIVPLTRFYPAEDYHQNYFNENASRNAYCSFVISPKLKKLLKQGLIAEDPVIPAAGR